MPYSKFGCGPGPAHDTVTPIASGSKARRCASEGTADQASSSQVNRGDNVGATAATQPLLTSSSAAAILAVSAGLRYGSASTSGPTSIRRVTAAIAVSMVHASWMPRGDPSRVRNSR